MCMASYNQAFSTLADADMWEEAVAAMAGFLAPTVARNVIEGQAGFDAPDELYGLLVVLAGHYSPMYGEMISLGGGVYTVDKLLERVELKQAVTNFGGN